jgi:hypothetical protein
MKRALAVAVAGFALSVVAAQAADSVEVKGWISDSKCGAKHVGSGAGCVKGCIQGGQRPVFVDEQSKQVWEIDNPDAVKNFYGDHVSLRATKDDANMKVHIDAIAEAQ